MRFWFAPIEPSAWLTVVIAESIFDIASTAPADVERSESVMPRADVVRLIADSFTASFDLYWPDESTRKLAWWTPLLPVTEFEVTELKPVPRSAISISAEPAFIVAFKCAYVSVPEFWLSVDTTTPSTFRLESLDTPSVHAPSLTAEPCSTPPLSSSIVAPVTVTVFPSNAVTAAALEPTAECFTVVYAAPCVPRPAAAPAAVMLIATSAAPRAASLTTPVANEVVWYRSFAAYTSRLLPTTRIT